MNVRIHMVTPVTGVSPPREADLRRGSDPDVTITQSRIEDGPASIESEFDEALAVPATLAQVQQAADFGADAIVINCMGDPGLAAARELVSVPVLGPGQTSMHVASMLGHRFSILTVADRLVHVDEDRAARYGLASRLASVRSVDVPVLDLQASEERLVAALTEQAIRAVRDDGAHVLVLGCTGMTGTAGLVAAALSERGVRDIPVIDPIPVTLEVAIALARCRLAQSKRSYPYPPPKARPGYNSLGSLPAA